jgi:integral membrane sensor domain MASE1
VPERSHAGRRMNLRSSAVGAVAGAIVVALLAAIDPATSWSRVALRSAVAFALCAAAGLTLSAASYWLRSARLRTASREAAGSNRAGADQA